MPPSFSAAGAVAAIPPINITTVPPGSAQEAANQAAGAMMETYLTMLKAELHQRDQEIAAAQSMMEQRNKVFMAEAHQYQRHARIVTEDEVSLQEAKMSNFIQCGKSQASTG